MKKTCTRKSYLLSACFLFSIFFPFSFSFIEKTLSPDNITHIKSLLNILLTTFKLFWFSTKTWTIMMVHIWIFWMFYEIWWRKLGYKLLFTWGGTSTCPDTTLGNWYGPPSGGHGSISTAMSFWCSICNIRAWTDWFMFGHGIGGPHDVMPGCMHIALFMSMPMPIPKDGMYVGNICGLMAHLLDNICIKNKKKKILYLGSTVKIFWNSDRATSSIWN